LTTLESELQAGYLQSLVDKRLTVLVEGSSNEQPGVLTGTACRYVPVAVKSRRADIGQLITARPMAVENGTLIAHECA
jgi:tRNA A37 methylthiotransferase MiaB